MANDRKYTDEELFKMMEEIVTERQKWKNAIEILMRPYIFGPLLLIFIFIGPLLGSNPLVRSLLQYLVNFFMK